MQVKKLVFSAVVSSVILLSGCASSDLQSLVADGSAVSTTSKKLKPTHAKNVKIYFANAGIPKHYRVIGHVSADNYSMMSIPHSEESIANELKKQAASIGGIGVINISHELDKTSGDVIVSK